MKRYSFPVGAAVTAVVLLAAGCGGGGSSDPALLQTTSSPSASPSEASGERAVPEQVTVYQPGLIDTDATVDDVPAWPGPAPDEFMDSHGPWGAYGTLSGTDAEVVYKAAVEHPDPDALVAEGKEPTDQSGSFWGLDGVVVLLFVQPQW